MRRDAGESGALEPRARVEQPGRDDAARARASPCRRETCLQLRREIEQVGGEAQRVLPLRRIGQRPEERADLLP